MHAPVADPVDLRVVLDEILQKQIQSALAQETPVARRERACERQDASTHKEAWITKTDGRAHGSATATIARVQ